MPRAKAVALKCTALTMVALSREVTMEHASTWMSSSYCICHRHQVILRVPSKKATPVGSSLVIIHSTAPSSTSSTSKST